MVQQVQWIHGKLGQLSLVLVSCDHRIIRKWPGPLEDASSKVSLKSDGPSVFKVMEADG